MTPGFDSYEFLWQTSGRRVHCFALVVNRDGIGHNVIEDDHWLTLCGRGPRASAKITRLIDSLVPVCRHCLDRFDLLRLARDREHQDAE